MKIYLSNFKPKKELPFPKPSDGSYVAIKDGEHIRVTLPDGTDLAIKMGKFENDYFSCLVDELVQMSPDELRNVLNDESEKIQKEIVSDKNLTLDSLEEILETDITMLVPFRDLSFHILETQEGHYSDDFMTPVDIYGLIHGGTEKGSGFNVGCSLKYLKRYMSVEKGKSYDPKDLLKAIHFLMFEYDARINNNG